MTADSVQFKARYEEVILPRSEVSGLVWLTSADEDSSKRPATTNSLRATLRDGSHLFLSEPLILGTALVGHHSLLEKCTVPLEQVLKLENGAAEWQSIASNMTWQLQKTPEPKFSDDGAGQGLDSLLIGQNVANISVSMIDDTELRLGDVNKIIVLDFWASWCAPCIRSLPRLVNLMKTFPEEKIRFIAVNEEENEFAIQGFLSNRGLEMEVGMDLDGSLASKFGVKTIPQTIIIAPGGKIVRHFVGAPTDLHESISNAITNMLPPTD